MTSVHDPNADEAHTLMFQIDQLMSARGVADLGPSHPVDVVTLDMRAPIRAVPCPLALWIPRHVRLAAAASHAQVQKQCCDDS